MQWSGGLRRMGHCQVKQHLDGAQALCRVSWRFVLLFATLLELRALVTLECAFAVVGKLVSG